MTNCSCSKTCSNAWLSVCGLWILIMGYSYSLRPLIKMDIKNLSKSVGLSASIREYKYSNSSTNSRTVPAWHNLVNSSMKFFREGPPNRRPISFTKYSQSRVSNFATHLRYHTSAISPKYKDAISTFYSSGVWWTMKYLSQRRTHPRGFPPSKSGISTLGSV